MTTNGTRLRVVILGCGRVGSTLAKQLFRDGHQVVVIDLTQDSFRRLGTKFKGQKLVGNGLDQDVLNRANLRKSDTFIAVTQGDNTNIMASQLAKEAFAVPQVVARIYDPIRAQAYRQMGIQTLCSTTIAAGLIFASVTKDDRFAEWQKTARTWDDEYVEHAG